MVGQTRADSPDASSPRRQRATWSVSRSFLKLGRADNPDYARAGSLQLGVGRQQTTPNEARECEILSVVCFRPPQLFGNPPCFLRQSFWPASADIGARESFESRLGQIVRDLPAPKQFMQRGRSFRPHEVGRHELFARQRFETRFRKARRDDDGRVNDQQSASNSRRPEGRDDIRHPVMSRSTPPAGRQGKHRFGLSQRSEIALIDEVLGPDLGCLEAA